MACRRSGVRVPVAPPPTPESTVHPSSGVEGWRDSRSRRREVDGAHDGPGVGGRVAAAACGACRRLELRASRPTRRASRRRRSATSRRWATAPSGSPRASGSKEVFSHAGCPARWRRTHRHRDGYRQHLRARPDGGRERRPDAGRGVSRAASSSAWASATHRRSPRAAARYASPVATMRAYLDAMDAARYGGPEPAVAAHPPAGRPRAHACSSCRPSGRTAPIPTSCPSSTPPWRARSSARSPAWRSR